MIIKFVTIKTVVMVFVYQIAITLTLRVIAIPDGLVYFVKHNHAFQTLAKRGIHASILEILVQNVCV
jgi:hypothetical protein